MDSAAFAEISALKSALAAAVERADVAEAEKVHAQAEATRVAKVVTLLQLEIAKLRRELYGQRSERKQRLLNQLELELEELAAKASDEELAAEAVPEQTTEVKGFTRKTLRIPTQSGH